MVKKPRTEVMPNKPLNPQPLASVTSRTHAMTKATTIIDIQDDLDLETFMSTIIVEHPCHIPTTKSKFSLLSTNSEPQNIYGGLA
jgi:hypothetical protein